MKPYSWGEDFQKPGGHYKGDFGFIGPNYPTTGVIAAHSDCSPHSQDSAVFAFQRCLLQFVYVCK